MVLWGRVPLYWNNQTCPNKVALTEHRGSKVWWKRLLPPLGVLCCSLKSNCAFPGVGVEGGITLPSHLWRGELVAIVVQETLKEEQMVSPPVVQTSIRSLPSACQCLGPLHTQFHSSVFYHQHTAGKDSRRQGFASFP